MPGRLYYFDTSYIVPLVVKEATSGPLAAFYATIDPRSLVTSQWTRAEFRSLLGIRVRRGIMASTDATKFCVRLERLLKAFRLVDIDSATVAKAALLLEHYELGLRSADALHLALSDSHSAELLTLDKTLLRTAELLGIAASTGTSLAGYER